MTKRFDKINEALDIDSNVEPIDVQAETVREISKKIIKESKRVKNSSQKEDIDLDYTHSRDNNYELTTTINSAIFEMFEIAKNTQKGRDFEVLGQLIKIAKEIDDGYLDRQQKLKKLKTNVTNNTTNALFVGSTAELQKYLKESLK
jgi:hypothetical protein